MDSNPFSWKTESDSFDEFKVGFKLALKNNAKTLLVLTCNDNNYPEELLNDLLTTCPVPVMGGIYPMVTYQGSLLKQGAIVIGFDEALDITTFANLDLCNDEESLDLIVNECLTEKNHLDGQENFLMFYDGLMTNVEDFIECLFESLDHSITIAGGGAGNLEFIQRPCVFTNQGLQSNVVQLANLARKLTTSIAHGWKTLEGPFLASETTGQTVQSLNYQPAFEVYAQTIEKDGTYKFTDDNFFDIAKHFPLGVEDITGNLIVRDPILTINNHLQCVGKVPINSMVYLLKGDNSNLISAANNAAKDLFSTIDESNNQIAIVFDCISRVLYLEDDFSQELNVINNQCHLPALFGVLSIGEIANNQSGSISLLNKSTVISAW